MASGYLIGGLQIVVGALLTFTGVGAAVGVPLMVSGAATIAGTALAPSLPRTRTLRDSPTYGLDRFNNPRGPETHVPIIYGEPKVRPAVIAESVVETAEGVSPSDVRNTRQQEFRWLGVLGEGTVASVDAIEINDRPIFDPRRTGVELGRGNGSRKTFQFPGRWVWFGDDELPDVEVFVDGTKKSWSSSATQTEFVVPATTYVTVGGVRMAVTLNFSLRRDNRQDRIITGTLRMYLRGPGYPEREQIRNAGTYQWRSQKVAPHRVDVWFPRTRPPEGWTCRFTYDVLSTSGMALTQDSQGRTDVVFGTAPANGARITANFRTANFPALRLAFRPGTLDQATIDGFTDLEVTRNAPSGALTKGTPSAPYRTDGREIDDARIGVMAPRGLIQYRDDGGTRAVSVDLRIEYRRQSSDGWTILRGPSGDKWTLIGERGSEMRFEFGIRDELERRARGGETAAIDALAGFGRGPLEIRLTRLTAVSNDAMQIDEITWTYVTEVLREGYVYPGTALLALRGRVAAFLSGQSLRVSCRARRGQLYDPRTAGGSRDIGSPFNPALAIRDLVTSSEGAAAERFGGGGFFAASDLWGGSDPATLHGLAAFADWCDEWVHRPGDDATQPASETNGERRCRLSVVLDTPSSLMETVADLAFLGFCFATLQGAKWRFPLDRDTDPVFTFDETDPTAQNAWNVRVSQDPWGRTPTGIQGSFWSELKDFERDEMLVPVDVPEGTPTNIRAVDLRGVYRETEAGRILRHLAEQAAEMPYTAQWDGHPGVWHVEAGDVVLLRTRVPYATGSTITELRVRVLVAVVGRGDDGAVTTRFAGRVVARKTAALHPVSLPSTARSAAAPQRAARNVTGLAARIRT